MVETSTWDRAFEGRPINDSSWTSATSSRVHGHRRRRRRRSSKRLDIQGLRAVAVLAVILNHLTSWVSGGFVGVDIFFVISGFLITGHLVADTSKRGHVSFGGFYLARARRILPAAVVTLAVTWVAAAHVFKGARVASIHNDVAWALGFGANVHFSRQGTDYFEANRAVSPVQHFWSLSVEEQFYLGWPLAIAVVMLVFGRRGQLARFRSVLLTLAVAAVGASFVFAVHQSSVAPTSAYFSTIVRVWELGLGAVLAVVVIQFPGLAARLGRARGPLAAAGLVAAVVSLFVVKSAPGFPAPWAALPVVATGLVIFAGSAGDLGAWTRVLTNRVAVYVGDTSYSLYLWHFPAIIYIGALVPNPAWVRYGMTSCAIAGCAIFSYHYIEQPFRRDSQVRANLGTNVFWVPMLTAMALAVAVFGIYLQRPTSHIAPISFGIPTSSVSATSTPSGGPSGPVSGPSSPTPVTTVVDPDAAIPSADFVATLKASIQATHWPSLTPPLSKLDLTTARAGWGDCFDLQQTESLRDCRFSNSSTDQPGKIAVVLGDSVAVSWLPAVRAALVPAGWTVYGITHGLCPAALVRVDDKPGDPGSAGDCDDHHEWMVSRTLGLKPSLVILSQEVNTLDRLRSTATGSAAVAEYQQGLENAERTFGHDGARVVTLTPPPDGLGLSNCDTVSSTPRDCLSSIESEWTDMEKAEHAAAVSTGSVEINTSPWFCFANYCPSFYGKTAIFYDKEHLTAEFAGIVGSQLRVTFTARKII